MAKIAVDVDDTLYSFGDVAKDALFRMAMDNDDPTLLRGAYTASTQWRIPNDTIGEEAWMEAIRLSHRPEVIASQTPFPGAPETLNALHDEGHELLYISNRDEEAAAATEDWLATQGFPIDTEKATLKCLWGDKLPHLYDCQYIIDDRPSTLVRFVFDYTWKRANQHVPRRGFGLVAPYNENLTDIEHIYLAPSWAGINYYLVGKSLLDEPAYEALALLGEVSQNGRNPSKSQC